MGFVDLYRMMMGWWSKAGGGEVVVFCSPQLTLRSSRSEASLSGGDNNLTLKGSE